ncbi:LuxR C-terminal-related transcriptional regulator [Actinokineospora fastidiosa]|uniref:LuxR C-terminal-related transcriptional regulator n=1 Tax=Actinokineospora fastidiosa TaxID=1816 RepID=UPI001E2E4987|nr:LuxR C-terminal-related transcriptional regulator [Actinokineospora fastidiosa]
MEGRVLEIAGDVLAFDQDEAESLLDQHGLRLPPEGLAELMAHTRGWAAGLRMAALWLADDPTRATTIAAFPTGAPLVAEYLNEEVLADQSPRARHVLMATSICDTVHPRLATELSGQRNVDVLLHQLAGENNLITRSGPGGQTYHYHPLLRSHLRSELARTRPGAPDHLHRVAARWFRAEGDTGAALRHARQARDSKLTVDLIASHGVQEILNGNSDVVREAIDCLPDGRVDRHASVVAALAALDARDAAAADVHLTRLMTERRAPLSRRTRLLLDAALLQRTHLGPSVRLPRHERPLSSGDEATDVLLLLAAGTTRLWSGDPQGAETELSRAAELTDRPHYGWAHLQAMSHLSVAFALTGNVVGLADRARRALRFAAEHGWDRTWPCAAPYAALAALSYHQGDGVRAGDLIAMAAELLPQESEPPVALAVLCIRAFIEFDVAAEPHGVVGIATGQWHALSGRHRCPQVVAVLAPTLARMSLQVEEPAWAEALADDVRGTLDQHAELSLLQAAIHAHHGRSARARRCLAPVLAGDLAPLTPLALVESWVLEAALADRAGDAHRAHQAVSSALHAAEPLGVTRLFRPVRDVLAQGVGRFGRADRFGHTVLSSLPAQKAIPDPLTSRERDLLVELPSMRTVEEIAESMYLSANTVKTHLRSIYRKLGVRQRRDAVTTARQLGLL